MDLPSNSITIDITTIVTDITIDAGIRAIVAITRIAGAIIIGTIGIVSIGAATTVGATTIATATAVGIAATGTIAGIIGTTIGIATDTADAGINARQASGGD